MRLHEILGIKKQQVLTFKDLYANNQSQKSSPAVLPLVSSNFNEILQGGFQEGRTYIIFGTNKTGKTQLCHQICVQAYKQFIKTTKTDNSQFIFYFDTENTFRPERIEDLVTFFNLKTENVLKCILVSKIMSNSALLLGLNEFEELLIEKGKYLLIIDTINSHFRSELSNENISYETVKSKFISILKKIDDLTRNHNLITILTAQVTANFSKKAIIKEIPVGNQFINHFFSEYLYLKSKDNEMNYVHLVNSLELTENKLSYKITSGGISDE